MKKKRNQLIRTVTVQRAFETQLYWHNSLIAFDSARNQYTNLTTHENLSSCPENGEGTSVRRDTLGFNY